MGLQLYKEDGVLITNYPALIIQVDTQSSPTGYSHYTDIENIDTHCFHISSYDYKTVRDCIKKVVADLGGGDVVAGFDLLTTPQKEVAAKHNIGSGTQIKDTITDREDRDNNSVAYLSKMKGLNGGARDYRTLVLEAITWSRSKHIDIEVAPAYFVTAPEFIYNLITIGDPNPLVGEMGGNLLTLYAVAGVLGFAGGDKSLGILDFLYSTVGTRFETTGLTTHPLLSGIIPDGFNNISEFRDWLVDIIVNGLFNLGHTTV